MTKLRELERRLKEEPDNLALRVAVAGALHEAGRHADAVELYRSVAIAYRDQGRPQQAIAVCRSILEIAPADAACRALLAKLGAPVAPAAPGPGPEPEPEPGTPSRPSWSDVTPLPVAVPYHIADPTARLRRVSESDLPFAEGAPTRPGSEDGVLPEVSGIANAARRISASLIAARARVEEDLSIELDTRPIRALPLETLAKIAGRSPTGPFEGDTGYGDTDHGDTGHGDTDYGDDDQTQPRDLPMGVRGARPPGLDPPGPTARSLLAFPFFAPLPVERRAAVLSRFSRRSVPPRTVVIRQGQVTPALVLVASGQLDVRAERAGAVIDLGTVGPGEHIGEAALLARAPAPATVASATEAELLLLAPRDFYELTGTFPALWAALKQSAERNRR
ncbi:MAG TPA: cyclic nucleotide-binding domain-containing protein [Kofleriaceae bacterium]|nr:cyclic nucleotide-binding domain-containing protein [Kofleriaceae bacterium]